MNLSNYLETKLLGVTVLHSPYTAPATVWVGLATACSSDGMVFSEVGAGEYARKVAEFAAPSGGASGNAATIQFPTAVTSWGQITHVALFDAVTSGNMLMWGETDPDIWANPGKQISFSANDLIVTFD